MPCVRLRAADWNARRLAAMDYVGIRRQKDWLELPPETRKEAYAAIQGFCPAPVRKRRRPRPRAEASKESYPRILTVGDKPPVPRKTPRAKRTKSTVGFIYIIWHPDQYADHGVLKIGMTDNPKTRIIAANTWSHTGSFVYALRLPVNNMRKAEEFLHDHFDSVRLYGEWFKVDLGTARMMARLVADDFPLCPDTHQLEIIT